MINIYQFAHAHGLDVVVRNRSGIVAQGDPSYCYATIDRAEVKVGTCLLQSTFGNGATPAEAVRNYAKNISSQLLVIDAYTPKRREIRVPALKLDEPAEFIDADGLAQLRRQADALHRVAAALGFEAGTDVTTAPIAVRLLVSKASDLETAHQATLADRDDWRTHARAASASYVAEQKRNKVLRTALHRAAAHIEEITRLGGKYHGLHGAIVADSYAEAKAAREALANDIAVAFGVPPAQPACAHPKAKTQYTGDGSPVSYCPDCGRNEAMPVRFQCDDTEGGAV